MNIAANTTKPSSSVWELPIISPELAANRTEDDIAEWRRLTESLKRIAEMRGWAKADAARKIGMADGTFSQWFSGKYAGRLDNTNAQVAKFIDQQEELANLFGQIPQSPPFFLTRTAREIMQTLEWAQMAADLVIATVGAGCGKTATCNKYKTERPNVFMITVSENTKTVNAMLTDLIYELGIHEHNPARYVRAIGQKLSASGNALLIVDEAQHLIPEAVNQLRHFSDLYKCGIALVGNDEVNHSFRDNKAKDRTYAQLRRRVGKRLSRAKPYPEDIQAAIAAWNVTDPQCVKFLSGIGNKGGALGQIDKTMKAATLLTVSTGEPLRYEFLKEAWENRNLGDFA
jgi:DNA transposition AAA+ family ATPase